MIPLGLRRLGIPTKVFAGTAVDDDGAASCEDRADGGGDKTAIGDAPAAACNENICTFGDEEEADEIFTQLLLRKQVRVELKSVVESLAGSQFLTELLLDEVGLSTNKQGALSHLFDFGEGIRLPLLLGATALTNVCPNFAAYALAAFFALPSAPPGAAPTGDTRAYAVNIALWHTFIITYGRGTHTTNRMSKHFGEGKGKAWVAMVAALKAAASSSLPATLNGTYGATLLRSVDTTAMSLYTLFIAWVPTALGSGWRTLSQCGHWALQEKHMRYLADAAHGCSIRPRTAVTIGRHLRKTLVNAFDRIVNDTWVGDNVCLGLTRGGLLALEEEGERHIKSWRRRGAGGALTAEELAAEEVKAKEEDERERAYIEKEDAEKKAVAAHYAKRQEKAAAKEAAKEAVKVEKLICAHRNTLKAGTTALAAFDNLRARKPPEAARIARAAAELRRTARAAAEATRAAKDLQAHRLRLKSVAGALAAFNALDPGDALVAVAKGKRAANATEKRKRQENEEVVLERKRAGKPSSSYRGVSWEKQRKKWHAQIKTSGKRQRLGFFVNELDAKLAYDAAAKKATAT